jgi:hypothetical protein
MEFAKYMIYNPNNVKIGIGDAKPQAESCLIYFPGDLNELNKYPDKYTDISVKSEWMGVRCYE